MPLSLSLSEFSATVLTWNSIILLSFKLLQLGHFCCWILRCFRLAHSFLLLLWPSSLQSTKRRRLCNLCLMLSSFCKHHPKLHGLQLPFRHLLSRHLSVLLLLLPPFFYSLMFDVLFLRRLHDPVSLRIEFFALVDKYFFANFYMLTESNFIEGPSTSGALEEICVLLRGVHRRFIVLRNCEVWLFVQRNVVDGAFTVHVEFQFMRFGCDLNTLWPSFEILLWRCYLFLRSLNLEWLLVLSWILRSILRWICWLIYEVWWLRSISKSALILTLNVGVKNFSIILVALFFANLWNLRFSRWRP